jgi:hypothetical protein
VLPAFYARCATASPPGCVAEPVWLSGRVTALLLCIGTPVGSLEDIAK